MRRMRAPRKADWNTKMGEAWMRRQARVWVWATPPFLVGFRFSSPLSLSRRLPKKKRWKIQAAAQPCWREAVTQHLMTSSPTEDKHQNSPSAGTKGTVSCSGSTITNQPKMLPAPKVTSLSYSILLAPQNHKNVFFIFLVMDGRKPNRLSF